MEQLKKLKGKVMKANELSTKDLMIGDWVNYRGICNRIAPADFCHFEWIDKIRPIPLTPEILEKNGFVNDDNNYGLRYYQSCGDVIGVDIRGDLGYLEDADLKYVHQLQHALRLCGIKKEIVL